MSISCQNCYCFCCIPPVQSVEEIEKFILPNKSISVFSPEDIHSLDVNLKFFLEKIKEYGCFPTVVDRAGGYQKDLINYRELHVCELVDYAWIDYKISIIGDEEDNVFKFHGSWYKAMSIYWKKFGFGYYWGGDRMPNSSIDGTVTDKKKFGLEKTIIKAYRDYKLDENRSVIFLSDWKEKERGIDE